MTSYQKIKAAAQAKGIDTRKDQYGGGGYWLYTKDGKPLYPDDNFCPTLRDLKAAIEAH